MCSLCTAPLRGPPIGGQDSDGVSNRYSAPYTLCLFEAFPSRGNKGSEEKNSESYTSRTIPVCPPLVAGATTFPPQAGALWMLSHGAMSLQESIERPILPLNRGKSGVARIGGGERSEPITRVLIMLYDTESQSRNAPCVPFRGRGPRSGEGVDGGNPDYDTRCGRDRRRRHYNTHRPQGDTTTLGPKARQT